MKKNLIVLAMSILPGNVKNVRQDLRAGKFAWEDGDSDGHEYYGQLEPISTMLREKEGSLDRVIILATKDAKKKVYDLDGEQISAVDFYLKRMNLSEKDAKIIDVEELDFVPAISDTVKEIRRYWKENENNARLWIDTQGSFRTINLVLNAVITLLEADGIVPSGIYSMNYNKEKFIQRIVNQTDTYKIFQFVSGINEFTRSGRAEQLADYYHQMNEEIPEIIRVMEKIAEAIQMCDMKLFDEYLKALRTLYKENGAVDELLGMFVEQIKRDYGKLLEADCSGLDIVEWFYRKGFYQQAITYIEAKLPEEWFQKKIISCKMEEGMMDTIKSNLSKFHEKDENVLIGQVVWECFKWRTICEKDEKRDIVRCKNLQQLERGIKKEYENPDNLHKISIVQKINGKNQKIGTMDVTIECRNKQRVMELLLLYKMLKNERNNFNHMSYKAVRANREQLGNAIRVFITTGKEVYEDVC